MAAITGRSGIVQVGANTVAEVTSFSLEETGEVTEDTELTDGVKTFLPDINSWAGSLECHWDPSDTNGQEALTAGASVTLHLVFEGLGAGNIDYNGSALVTSISRNASGGSTVTASFSFQGSGVLTRTVLV